MATINSTPRAGLPQWGANDQVKFMTDMSTAFLDIDKKFALTGDAVIPCTAAYDTATKRHTLTPTQTGITLPDIFTARFLATTAFTAGDKVYIGGAEYIPSYTDGDTAVETGVWIVGAVVSLDCKKAGLKAYVGAGFGKQLSQKADIRQGTWDINLSATGAEKGAYIYNARIGTYYAVGDLVNVYGRIDITKVNTPYTGNLIISGFPFISAEDVGFTMATIFSDDGINNIGQMVFGSLRNGSNYAFFGSFNNNRLAFDTNDKIPIKAGTYNIDIRFNCQYRRVI